MSVMAVEAVPEAAEAGPEAASGGSGGFMPAGGGGGQQKDSGQKEHSKGVLLAIAIVLLWLAAFCFFIAFEGQKLLGEQSDTSGGGLLKAMLGGLAGKAQAQESEGT